jgi:hypothetical protein
MARGKNAAAQQLPAAALPASKNAASQDRGKASEPAFSYLCVRGSSGLFVAIIAPSALNWRFAGNP